MKFLPGTYALLLAAWLVLPGCYAEDIADLRSQIEHLQVCQRCAQNQLTQGLALALRAVAAAGGDTRPMLPSLPESLCVAWPNLGRPRLGPQAGRQSR